MVYYDGEHGTTTLQLPPLVGKDATSVGALPETEPVLFLGGEEHGGRPAQSGSSSAADYTSERMCGIQRS